MNLEVKKATRQSYGEKLAELGRKKQRSCCIRCRFIKCNKNINICKRIPRKIF